MFDVLILNGVVVDGTGAGGYRADVGVVGERIDAIGDLARAETRRVINAAALTVAPTDAICSMPVNVPVPSPYKYAKVGSKLLKP